MFFGITKKTELFSLKTERFCLKDRFSFKWPQCSDDICSCTCAVWHDSSNLLKLHLLYYFLQSLCWKHPEGAADNTSTGPLCSDTNYFCWHVVHPDSLLLHWTMLRDSLVTSLDGKFQPVELWPACVCNISL